MQYQFKKLSCAINISKYFFQLKIDLILHYKVPMSTDEHIFLQRLQQSIPGVSILAFPSVGFAYTYAGSLPSVSNISYSRGAGYQSRVVRLSELLNQQRRSLPNVQQCGHTSGRRRVTYAERNSRKYAASITALQKLVLLNHNNGLNSRYNIFHENSTALFY